MLSNYRYRYSSAMIIGRFTSMLNVTILHTRAATYVMVPGTLVPGSLYLVHSSLYRYGGRDSMVDAMVHTVLASAFLER